MWCGDGAETRCWPATDTRRRPPTYACTPRRLDTWRLDRSSLSPQVGKRSGTARQSGSTDSAVNIARCSRGRRGKKSMVTANLDTGGVPLVVHVVPTPRGRGAQLGARILVDRLDEPGTVRHRLLGLVDGPPEVAVDLTLGHAAGSHPAEGFEPRLALRLRKMIARLNPAVVVAHGGDAMKYAVPATRRHSGARWCTASSGPTRDDRRRSMSGSGGVSWPARISWLPSATRCSPSAPGVFASPPSEWS